METPVDVSIESQIKDLAKIVIEGFRRVEGKFDQIDGRLDQMDNRFDQMDNRFDQVDKRLDHMEKDMQSLRTELDKKPDREEVRMIVRDEAKNNPGVYLLDREQAEFLDKVKLRGMVKEVVYEVLAEKS